MRDRRGFTLIELMIGISIITIVSVIAISNFQLWLYHARYTGFLRDVFNEFQKGRQLAVSTSAPHIVEVDAAANTVRLRRSSDGNIVTDNAYVHNAVTAPFNCDIVSGTSVTFNSNGSATSNGNVRIVNLKAAADNQLITVTLGTGRVKIQ